MNITFLIGNGFDRNLGLRTTYSDFVNEYKKIESKTDTIKKFKQNIKDNEELWSSAEIAMGKYTSQFKAGEGEAFSECHTDFCECLAQYLKNQMERMEYSESSKKILHTFLNLNNITQPFPTQERDTLDAVYSGRKSEPVVFNFICYNYTDTLDQCLSVVENNPNILGSHRYGSQVLSHSVGQICHVHGTVDKEMVFGVNDDSQITNLDVFECEDGDLYKNMLIKVQTNASYLENTDEKAARLIKNSNLIYVYGMSIGETDKLWWDRICTWLAGSSDRHLIVQKYDMPVKTVMQISYQLAERRTRREITKYSSYDDAKKKIIENRIHITGDNLFSGINNIANDDNININNLNVLELIESKDKELASV